jgi:hypothetical protein
VIGRTSAIETARLEHERIGERTYLVELHARQEIVLMDSDPAFGTGWDTIASLMAELGAPTRADDAHFFKKSGRLRGER